MARSGSTNFALDRDGIIRGAVRIVKGMGGKMPEAASSGQEEFTNAAEALNMMLKSWQTMGVGLWTTKEINMPFAYRDGKYSLGDSGDNASETLVVTEIATAASSGASSIIVDSITGISDADKIGIELDDKSMQWTTINGSPSGSTITLTDVLTDDVAVDNEVMTYTTISGRPMEIKEARLVNDAGSETELDILDRDEWMLISNKNTNGVPSQVYYDPQLDSGILYVWPRPDDVASYIKFTARMPIQDFDASTDSPDFPQEVYRAAKFNLAVEISPEYQGVDQNRFVLCDRIAKRTLNQVIDFDAETGTIRFESESD